MTSNATKNSLAEFDYMKLKGNEKVGKGKRRKMFAPYYGPTKEKEIFALLY